LILAQVDGQVVGPKGAVGAALEAREAPEVRMVVGQETLLKIFKVCEVI
jgi:hypothetical protein